jgi:hypothetical protein
MIHEDASTEDARSSGAPSWSDQRGTACEAQTGEINLAVQCILRRGFLARTVAARPRQTSLWLWWKDCAARNAVMDHHIKRL